MEFNIVTFHTAYNQGAMLQTLALQEFIKEKGYSVGVYDYRPPIVKSFSGIKGKIFNILRKKNESEEKRFENFMKDNFNLNLELNSKIFLSGSDQVWNPTGSMDPIYFLKFVGDDSLRASYAASMGKCKVPEEKKELFRKYIERFDMVSVREEDVKECVSEYFEGDITVNVDPTLLMDKKFWMQYAKKVENCPSEYILAYILHLPKNVNKLLKWLQRETGAKIVLIDGQGVMTHFVKNDVSLHNIGPNEFLWLVANAKSIVTSSFHGTAFSIIFEKEFYSIVNPNAPSRINNILNLCGLRAVKETDMSFERYLDINWESVEQTLAVERKKSEEYIDNVYKKASSDFRKKIKGTVEQMRDRCTGCSACEAVCPVNAIQMVLNQEGFYEPKINKEYCIECSKCLHKCPLDKKKGTLKKKSYYGWNKDKEVCFNSSSGGIFGGLADSVIARGGIVFGAVYSEDWKSVEFSDTDHVDLKRIQKSKYTVSNPSGIYRRIKEQLDTGREVLFCGTPCQNAGLTSYLGKDYANLIRCDFVCGGMASLEFYREHISKLEQEFESKIKQLDFRPKNKGWGKQRIDIQFENGKKYEQRSHRDSYFKCFANEHVSVRSICLDCEYYTYHVSDITLADFWGYKTAGVEKNEKGLSLIVGNTEKGIAEIENNKQINIYELESKYSDYAFRSKSPNLKKVKERNIFFEKVKENGGSYEQVADELYKASEMSRIKVLIKLKLKI